MYNLALVELSIKIDESIEEIEDRVNKVVNNANNKKNIMIYYIKTINYISIIQKKIADNVVTIHVIGKAKVGKKQDVETMLRRDFYREFESSLTSNEENRRLDCGIRIK